MNPRRKSPEQHAATSRHARRSTDHRVLGAQLELFHLDPEVGTGLPLWLPRGAALRRTLEEFVTAEESAAGYQHVVTPHLGREQLYRTSGHYPHYRDTMYPLLRVENERYVLKPMNCPHHIRIYQARPRSYRDLPLRFAEFGTLYRYERSGVLLGLTRVRGMTLNDAHIFCREDQILGEVRGVLRLIEKIYSLLGLTEYRLDLALHDPKRRKKYGTDGALWEKAVGFLRAALRSARVPFREVVGEAAFYAPKADLQMRDVTGREFTVSTIQLDFLLPERFGLTYTTADGTGARPVIIHRAPIGTLERFIAFLLEHFQGVFPLWLAPVQVRVLPVSAEVNAYAETVHRALLDAHLRAELDARDETLPKKIRTGELSKIPVLAVVGKKEAHAGTVSLRAHGGQNLGTRALAEASSFLQKHVARKSLSLR